MPNPTKTASAERLQFVEPMYARAVRQLPEGKDWVYEVKFDGYRYLAGRDSSGVTLWSRRANRLTDQFPTVAGASQHLPPDTLLREIFKSVALLSSPQTNRLTLRTTIRVKAL